MSTKRLARELGLIRKRSQSSSGQKKQTGPRQLFSHLIVIDFESTCWREKNNYGQEIIEFPAVLLNTSNGEIESEFHSYVQPQEHPVLSEFCTELTGITQKQVEAGLPLRICLSRFARWLHTLQQEKGVVCVTDSKNTPASGHLCTFLTWSDWDLGVCLLYECKRKQITKPEVLNSWIDLRATYKAFYSRKPKGLNGALQDLGIQFSGREHSGTNTLNLELLSSPPPRVSFRSSSIPQRPAQVPLKSRPLFVHHEAQSRSHSPVGENQLSSGNHSNRSSAGNPNPNPPTSVGVQSLVSTRTVLSSLVTPVCVNTPRLRTTLQNPTHSSTSHLTFDPEVVDSNWSEGEIVTEAGESGSYDDVLLEDKEWVGLGENDKTAIIPLNSRPHPFKPHLSKPCPSTSTSASATLLPLTDPYRSLARPGRHSTTTTPSMHFSIYTDQSDHTSSTASRGGSFRVPHPVLSHVNQSAFCNISTNQSAVTSCSSNQSKGSSSSVNQSVLPSVSTDQSAISTCSTNQTTKMSSVSFNQSALSSISVNQSAGSSCTNNQSKLSSISFNQSALSSLSVNQSGVSSSTCRRVSDSVNSAVCQVSKVTKVTSPLCACGRRAKRLAVCNGGPNHGRAFFTCPVRRSGSTGPAHKGGCGFFKWESAVINSSVKRNSIGFSVKTPASRKLR
ncbi:hypothetical protein AOLI_G00233060 [Acnodon oligacanthus]